MTTDAGPVVLLDIGANPDSTPENLAQYARMGAIFADRVLGVADPARRAPLDRRGEGQGRRPDPAGDRAHRPDEPAVRRQRRGQGPRQAPWPTSSSATRSSATSSSSSSRACRATSSTCSGPSSAARSAAGSRTCCCKPGIARIRGVFDYERAGGSPLLGVSGTVIITHGRARRRMVGYGVAVAATMARTRVPELIAEAFAADGGGAARRRDAGRRGRRATQRPPSPWSPRRERPRADRRARRHRRDGPARRVRGAGRQPGRPRRAAVAWRSSPGPGSSPGCRTTACGSASGSSPAPATPSSRSTRQVRSAVAATVERLLGLRLESVTVTVDGVGG